MLVICLFVQLLIDPLLSVDLVQAVLNREPLVIISINTGPNIFLNSAVGSFLFPLEVVDVVDVVVDAVGLIQMILEALQLEIELVSRHAANIAVACFILSYLIFLLSELTKFIYDCS